MTTGSYTTGPYPSPTTEKFHSARTWSGGDGKTITDRFTRKPKWNNYEMAHKRIRCSNPNKVGYITIPGNTYTERTNHSFRSGSASLPFQPYGPVDTLGNIPSTFPTSQFNSIWTAREELALLSKMLKKVRGHELSLGVSLAEVDKLAGSVLNTLKSIVYGVEDLRKLRFAAFARRFSASPPRKDAVDKMKLLDISGRYLEMRYAWEPTINDVFEAAKAFEEISNGPRQLYNRAAKRKRLMGKFSSNYCKDIPQVVEVRRSYLYEYYEEMSFARQMGLMNPAEIIWERIPFSFVLDWFIPIGTYLSLIGQIPFMKGRWLRTSSIRWNSSGSGFENTDPNRISVSPYPDCDFEMFNMQRTVLSGPPGVPFPTFKVNGALSGKRVLNAIALAHQLVFNDGSRTTYHYN